MSYILHLSDLHLGLKQVTDDFKNDIVAVGDRPNRIGHLKNTFEELGNKLRSERETLSAIVITGDVTLANDPEGFNLLPDLLQRLKNVCPPANKIVVVPGNHDVGWRTPHGSKERYANFLSYIRRNGYITPFLDGVDIKTSTQLSPKGHYLFGPNYEWLVIPINSSNYCGSLAPIPKALKDKWNELPKFVNKTDVKNVEAELSGLLLHDVARISEDQLKTLRYTLSVLEKEVARHGKSFDDVIKIAAIHHHLLPVSESEEFKTFESITNLSLLRGFLLSNGINVVLHGHKHTGYVYWDHIYGYAQNYISNPHCALVISGATLGSGEHDEICRLIKIDSRNSAAKLSVARLGVIRSGAATPDFRFEKHSLWEKSNKERSIGPHWTIIEGITSEVVYSRLRSIFDELSSYGAIQYVMCVVKNTSTAQRLPEGYPNDVKSSMDGQLWFDDLISWWQAEDSRLREQMYFTHGNRIYHYLNGTAEGINQFERATKRLASKDTSSRAIMTLFNPTTDLIHVDPERFPSFSFVQFIIRKEANSEARKLDCIGYFRKQEMKYWWPVNVAELSLLQKKMYGELKREVKGLEVGSITTITAIAHASTSPPKVAVPAVDRTFDRNPEKLWSMVHDLFWSDVDTIERADSEWKQLLDDLTPPATTDQDGAPVAIDGIRYLYEVASKFARHHQNSPASKIANQLEELYELNKQYAAKILNDDISTKDHERWRERVIKIIDEMRVVLKKTKQRRRSVIRKG